MNYRPIGYSGLVSSRVILGTWATGGFQWGGTDETEAVNAIKAALDAGVNTIDTAPIYGFGESERRVGIAIKGRREGVVVATKCGLIWHMDKGRPLFRADDRGITDEQSGRRIYSYLGSDSIRYELEESLRRLQTDYVDLYQVHRMDDLTPIEDVMETLLSLKKEGKIRAIGLSNAALKHLMRYCEIGQIDSDQERYSLFDRDVEERNMAYCRNNGIAFLAYSPLFHGLLTGKVNPNRRYDRGDFRSTRHRFAPDYVRKVNMMLGRIEPIAFAYKMTLAGIILAYMLTQPGCTHLVVGARSSVHAVENAKAGEIVLSSEDVKAIDKIISGGLPSL